MSKLPPSLTRRQFVRLTLVGATTTLVEVACQGLPASIPTATSPSPIPKPAAKATKTPEPLIPTATLPPSPTPEPAAAFPPLPESAPEILANRNDPHYNVRYVNPFPPVDHEAWRLEVTGLVEKPGNFSLEDLLGWPQMEQVSRMICVEGWSFEARWGGFQYQALAERVVPQSEATHVRFDCADGYWEFDSIEELSAPCVVFVLSMNDELLLDEYGAPLRMMFPTKYGYKSAKAVTSVTFTDEGGAGYWSTVGSYSIRGDI
jgi:DMSO/TMAO reductase YedYZ molybdopterin-dependent catalytic subunit